MDLIIVSVVEREVYPTAGYVDEDNFLPQWAIAVIVIGLASLLFVIIFGVTVVSCTMNYYFNLWAEWFWRSALVQQLSVRKDPRSYIRCLIKHGIIIFII